MDRNVKKGVPERPGPAGAATRTPRRWRAPDPSRLRPLYAGALVWVGVFGLLWVFG